MKIAVEAVMTRFTGLFERNGTKLGSRVLVNEILSIQVLSAGLIGALAGLLALPTGYAVALILVRLINRRSFGWTFELFVEAEPFVLAFTVSIIAALLAGIYPAYRIGRLQSIEAMRFD